jgi:hypothetical protein
VLGHVDGKHHKQRHLYYIDYTGKAIKLNSTATATAGTVPGIVGVTTDPTATGNPATLYGKFTVIERSAL